MNYSVSDDSAAIYLRIDSLTKSQILSRVIDHAAVSAPCDSIELYVNNIVPTVFSNLKKLK